MEESKNGFFSRTPVLIAFALICCALWGSATPFIKTGYLLCEVNGVPSTMLFAGIRFTLAGFLTILIYSIARKRVLIPKKDNVGRILVVALFQTILQYIFFYVGLANTSGVKGTVLSGSTAFFAVLISALIFRQEKLTPIKILACILGFAGIIVVNLKGLDFNMNFLGDAFVLFSSIASGFSSVFSKKFSKYEDPVVISGYQFFVGGIVMMIIGASFGGTVTLGSIGAVGVLLYLAALSAVAYSLWGMLLKYNPVSRVTIFSFMTPVFGVILSKLILTESSAVSLSNVLVALALICAGIITINYQKTKN